MDGHPAYARAIRELKESGELGRRCRCRTSPYLNNIIEQDHRFIKKRIVASLGFRSVEGAWRTIEGYEAMHAIRKGQIRWLAKGDAVGQRQFIHVCSASLCNTGLKRIAGQVRLLLFATDPPVGQKPPVNLSFLVENGVSYREFDAVSGRRC